MSKAEVFSAIRRRLPAKASKLPPACVVPRVDAGDLEGWKAQLEQMHASVEAVGSSTALVAAISAKAREWQLDSATLTPALAHLLELFADQGLSVNLGVASPTDSLTVGLAYAGVIESGALVMHSSAISPVSNHFLPEYSIIVVNTEQLFPTLEDVWQEMGQENGQESGLDSGKFKPMMPRTINVITGPSKTADIEQTIVYGAHGPKVLHVVLLQAQLLA